MKLGREPIFQAGAFAAFVVLVLNLLVAFGVPLTDDQRRAIIAIGPPVAGAAVWLATWLTARQRTTPLNSPRNADGEPLMTARTWQIADRAKLTAAIESARQRRKQAPPPAPAAAPAKVDPRDDPDGFPWPGDTSAEAQEARRAIDRAELSDLRGLPVALSTLQADAARHGMHVVKTGTPGMMYDLRETVVPGKPAAADGNCGDADCIVCGDSSTARDLRFAMAAGSRVKDDL